MHPITHGAACALALLAAGPALAQDQSAGSAEDAATTLGILPAAPARRPFQPFEKDGVTLLLNYTGEAAANPSGGVRQGAAYTGQVFLGADLDMARIAGVAGGTVHLAVTNRHGQNLAATRIGTSTSVQEVFGTQNTHLAILTWQQKLAGGRLEIEAGKTVANIAFLNSPIYCHFQSNSACGNPTFVFKTSNFTYFPASSWGAHATAHLTDKLYLHVGAYEVNPRRKRANDSGFTASFKGTTGVIVPFELGYGTDFANDRLPRHYQAGGWIDRGDYADPLVDAAGAIALLSGQPALTRHGRAGGFVRFDQMVWRPDDHSQRGLTLFGVAMKNLSGRVIETRFLELGLLQTGTFRGRDRDTIGFMVNDQRFSDLALRGLRAARASVGARTDDLPRHQYMMELAYGAQIAPALRISPNVQYIVNPDQLGDPFRRRNARDALVLGFKFTVDAPTLLAH
ncbi:carbohydrate porin [Sphingomonas solaris]|uniref:Carbohydrate porin n=1 Tax=Alterirhizorhabdus solaris TaxID=2529389 RepID=A0A558R6X9_9SPHN|nr:carbohydrate porin [Sphingomonas solaris]TVV75134.1 carbohydrate porin [Sphingomonas solaris]